MKKMTIGTHSVPLATTVSAPRLYHTVTGQCIAAHLEIANTFWTRFRGLMLRGGLAQGHGLWIRPCNGVHTFWMRFAIDVIFLDRDMRVVKLVENMRPFRVTVPQRAARSVVELPAHTIAQQRIQLGDKLRAVRE